MGSTGRGLAVIISAPAGTGKTTLVKMLLDEFPSALTQSVSCTTRPPRLGEVEGKHYIFLSETAFQQKIDQGDFLEHAQVFGYRYGTLKKAVERQCLRGKHVILVIDTQGALALKEKLEALFVFIEPPSMEVLAHRLTSRRTESKALIDKRLEWARYEIDQAIHYDYRIVNDELKIAYHVLKSIIIAEEHRVRHVN